MRLADGIRERGFRGWYQRELSRGHAGLLLLIVAAVGALAMAERASRDAPAANRLGALVLLLACAGIAVWALRRYFHALMRAEFAAGQAVCRSCQAYGRLDLLREEPASGRLEVACKRCGSRWEMVDPG